MDNRQGDWRHSNIGRLMNNAIFRFEKRVFELLSEAGHSSTRQSHLHLTRNLDTEGTRITELAKRAQMTKQAMGDLVRECEALGLVARTPDPTDARAKIVIFTPAGLKWLDSFKSAVEQAEREMRAVVGTKQVGQIAAVLRDYGRSS